MEEGREHYTMAISKSSQCTPIEPSSGQDPRDPQSHQMHNPLEPGCLGGEIAAGKGGVSPGRCHLTYCDGVVAQETLHSAGAILDKQGLAQVLEGEGLGRVKAVVFFYNKDPD